MYNSNFEPIDKVFEGMLFDIRKSPILLHDTFKNIEHIRIEIIQSIYFIKFRNLFIANIHKGILTLTPGIFIHHEINVFKTYNKLLRVFVKNRFIKFMNDNWILCQNVE